MSKTSKSMDSEFTSFTISSIIAGIMVVFLGVVHTILTDMKYLMYDVLAMAAGAALSIIASIILYFVHRVRNK